MKKIIIFGMITIGFNLLFSCKKAPQQVSTTNSTAPNKDIQQVKDFFEQLKTKKHTRTTIPLSDDSLVYYIEADLNINLGNFTYDKDVLTTKTVEVDVPYNTTGYNSTDIESAVASMQTVIQDKFDELDISTNVGLVVLYVDVELVETTSTHKKLRGMGVFGVDVDVDANDRYPENDFRFWPYYTNAYNAAKGYCTDYTQGIRTSDLPNTIPGYMTIIGRQMYVDYLYPNGLPQQYQNTVIDIHNSILFGTYLATNPYRPSYHSTQWGGQTAGECFNKAELNFYLDLSHPNISSYVSSTSQSYLTHWWITNAICPSGQGGVAVPSDYNYGEDYIRPWVGTLVPKNQ